MNVGKTLFAQVMEYVPWKTFGRIIDRHGGDAVRRVAALVDGAIKVFLLASNFDVRFVHPPAVSRWVLTAAKDEHHDWQNFQRPAVYRGVVNKDATLPHHFFQVAKAQRVSCAPTGAYQHHF
jgi:hypothetical protein